MKVMATRRLRNVWQPLLRAMDAEPSVRLVASAWAAAVVLYYLPYAFPDLAHVETHDFLNSELVYSAAVGALWRGDESISSAFLNGNVPVLTLARLTQPLSGIYALLPPFAAFWLTDIIVRAVAAIGSYFLLREIGSPRLFSHLAAALFALNIANSTFLLTVAGLPGAIYLLLKRRTVTDYLLLLAIGWHTSLYLSGIFFLALIPVIRLIFRRPLDREFWFGVSFFAVGLLLGNLGLILLAMEDIRWNREDWDTFNLINFPLPFHHVGTNMLTLVATAAYVAVRDFRGRRVFALIVFVIIWFMCFQLAVIQQWQRSLGSPIAYTDLSRFYFLWTTLIILLFGIAACTASRKQKALLCLALIVEFILAALQHQHLRHFARIAAGREDRYPTFNEFYGFDWFEKYPLPRSAVVMSVGIEPMVAPMNGVRSIDGNFQIYPLEYKRRFRRVIENSFSPPTKEFYSPFQRPAEIFDGWGGEVYAFYPRGRPELINFCAASDMGATHVIASEPINSPSLVLLVNDGWRLYRIKCSERRDRRHQLDK